MSDRVSTHTSSVGSARNPRAESVSSRQLLDLINQRVPNTQGYILSTMPRGSLNIVQPARSPEHALRSYASDFHRQDRMAWTAIGRGTPVRAAEVWGKEFEASNYYQAFIKPLGLRHVVAAPLAGPIFAGYPGVVLVGRSAAENDFTDAEVNDLGRIAREVSAGDGLRGETTNNNDPWAHRSPARFMVFNREATQIFPGDALGLDERLTQQLQQRARQSLDQLKRGYTIADRMLLPDTWGDLWVFRGVVCPEFMALSDGPVVVFCLQPEAAEWVAVKPADVQADPEIVRLLPSLRFMQQEFHENPTLAEIAKKAHLSPFHFHRRFTDLIGQTPKHFLLSCQVHQAKRMLMSRKRELAQIATDCGFAHQSHFTSRFKQATGLTPTRWRRLAAQISEGATSN